MRIKQGPTCNLRMQGVDNPFIPYINDLIAQNPGTISPAQGTAFYPPAAAAIQKRALNIKALSNISYLTVIA